MKMRKVGLSILALVAMTAQGYAEDLCNPNASAALKTAAIQQELMVAGFTCNASNQYNRFVLAWRGDLQASDAALMAYFRARDNGREDGYDSYKTKAANLSASRSAADGARYCANIARDFAAAGHSASLGDFVAHERLLIAAPEACAVKYDMPEVAVAGPSYALPASPYGPPSSYKNETQARTAYNDPTPTSRNAQTWNNSGYAYGPPPGWLPPPPARRAYRGGWYGGSPYSDY